MRARQKSHSDHHWLRIVTATRFRNISGEHPTCDSQRQNNNKNVYPPSTHPLRNRPRGKFRLRQRPKKRGKYGRKNPPRGISSSLQKDRSVHLHPFRHLAGKVGDFQWPSILPRDFQPSDRLDSPKSTAALLLTADGEFTGIGLPRHLNGKKVFY